MNQDFRLEVSDDEPDNDAQSIRRTGHHLTVSAGLDSGWPAERPDGRVHIRRAADDPWAFTNDPVMDAVHPVDDGNIVADTTVLFNTR